MYKRQALGTEHLLATLKYSKVIIDELQAYSPDMLATICLLYTSTYGLAVRKEIAEKYNLKAYSDLKAVASQLVFGAEYDFYEREDGYDALCNSYGLSFKETRDMDIGLKYQATVSYTHLDVYKRQEWLLELHGFVILKHFK